MAAKELINKKIGMIKTEGYQFSTSLLGDDTGCPEPAYNSAKIFRMTKNANTIEKYLKNAMFRVRSIKEYMPNVIVQTLNTEENEHKHLLVTVSARTLALFTVRSVYQEPKNVSFQQQT